MLYPAYLTFKKEDCLSVLLWTIYCLGVCVFCTYIHTSICPPVCLSIHLITSTKQIFHEKLTVGQLVKKFPALTVLILTTFLTIKLKASFIGHLFTTWQTVECQHFLAKGGHKTGNSTKSFKSRDFFCYYQLLQVRLTLAFKNQQKLSQELF